ncbi:unnamed protein product, partial [marine sediment metagenome]
NESIRNDVKRPWGRKEIEFGDYYRRTNRVLLWS